jgi:uncharacterized membrane protein
MENILGGILMEEKNNYQVSDTGPWKVFAIVGFVMGILSLVFCWIPFSNFYLGAPGLVLSILGKKSATKIEYAMKGFTLNLVGIIINVLVVIAYIALIVVGAITGVWFATNY